MFKLCFIVDRYLTTVFVSCIMIILQIESQYSGHSQSQFPGMPLKHSKQPKHVWNKHKMFRIPASSMGQNCCLFRKSHYGFDNKIQLAKELSA